MKTNLQKHFAESLTSLLICSILSFHFLMFQICQALDAEKEIRPEWQRLMDLRGQWKFELGDESFWADPEFDDSAWENIFVPSHWENEGFPGYDGFAWYRKEFSAKDLLERNNLYLNMGFIDDVDEVYINGHLIGYRGSFPPESQTGYQNERVYYVPPHFLNTTSRNMIAVRVYDIFQAGGIAKGNIGFYQKNSYLNPDFDLSGVWKFSVGDQLDWKEADYPANHWQEVVVPAMWDSYGFKDYDGFGWYRREFELPASLENDRLILLMGRIDDLDEVYLNGEKIGRTGKIYSDPDQIYLENDAWLRDRAYTIPAQYLKFDARNVLAVRVYDGLFHGGIYEGPIGIVTRDHYLDWERKFRKRLDLKGFFVRIFGR